jgi:nitroimidazol reductase NimA-like FMN-containing flavoprotein (pyridoxamine 5'-phosphate oxidase superfamily)
MLTMPVASLPKLPPDYGLPDTSENLLPWSHVNERMTASMHYWISTTSPDGAPYTRPIDGMWLDDRLYFGGDDESRWRKNLANDPRACVTLENAEQAVILHGTVAAYRADADMAVRLAEASNAKYDMGQTAEEYARDEILMFTPHTVFAWKVLYEDATRWRWSKD